MSFFVVDLSFGPQVKGVIHTWHNYALKNVMPRFFSFFFLTVFPVPPSGLSNDFSPIQSLQRPLLSLLVRCCRLLDVFAPPLLIHTEMVAFELPSSDGFLRPQPPVLNSSNAAATVRFWLTKRQTPTYASGSRPFFTASLPSTQPSPFFVLKKTDRSFRENPPIIESPC